MRCRWARADCIELSIQKSNKIIMRQPLMDDLAEKCVVSATMKYEGTWVCQANGDTHSEWLHIQRKIH